MENQSAADPTLEEAVKSWYKDMPGFKTNPKWNDAKYESYIAKDKDYRDRVMAQAYAKIKFTEKTKDLNALI